MDVRQLEILRALGDLGSVRAVAEELRVSPSAVSQQLRLLQRPVPVPLTRKEGRVLRLTEAGEALAAAAADVAAALAQADVVVRGLGERPGGTVTISAFNSAALAIFPPLASAFGPDASTAVRFHEEDVAQSDFAALTRTYDVVVAHRMSHTPAWPESVRVVPLLDEPLDVALPKGHRLAARKRLTAAAVVDQPWITTHSGFPVEAALDTVAAVAGQHPNVRHRVNEFTVVAELVRSGAGLAFLPRLTQPLPPGVVRRPLSDAQVSRSVDALVSPESLVRPAVGTVLDRLLSIAHELKKSSA